jgi:hypothetical protein
MERQTIRAKPVETEVGEILACVSGDKLKDGSAINSGSMFMTMHGGKATLKHKGKTITIGIAATLGGSTILHAPNGRTFHIKLEKLINHAIAHGLLDPKLRFERAKPRKGHRE